jgi:hypothetical protein
VYGTLEDLSAAEKINSSYVSRILRLTLLAPDIVEAILDGHPCEMSLAKIMQPFASSWAEKRQVSALLYRRKILGDYALAAVAVEEHQPSLS